MKPPVKELTEQEISLKIRKLLWEKKCVLHTRTICDLFEPKEANFVDVERIILGLVKKGELRASKIGVWLPTDAPEWGRPR